MSDTTTRMRQSGGFAFLWTLYHKDLPKLGVALVCYLVKTSPLWLMPLLIAQIITLITVPHTSNPMLFFLSIGLIFGVVLQNIPTHYLYSRFLSGATRNMERRLRSKIIRQLNHLSMHFYYRSDLGALQSKLLRDVEMVELFTKQIFEGVIQATVLILVAVLVTALSYPWFLLFYLLTVPATVILFAVLGKPLRQHNATFRREIEAVSAKMNEMLHLIPLIRAHGIEQVEMERIDQNLRRVQAAGLRLDGHAAVTNSSSWVTLRLLDAFCLAVAGYIAFSQILPLPVAAVILLTGYFRNLIDAAVSLLNIVPQLSKGWESLSSIREILDEEDLEHNEGKRQVEAVQGHFRFENVSFTYPNASQEALQSFSLKIKPGMTIALVGHSGSGKTTLMNLIIGFLRPTEGRILLDGMDMNDLDLRSYRQFLGMVSQETLLFKGSIRENITFGAHEVDESRFLQALADANVAEFVDKLPLGVETQLGENGARLSGGQRQRIAIARALLRNPRVLILDEATSGLDSLSEALVKEALGRLMRARTTFIAAHRLSTVRNADLILVLEQGRIVESGTHETLLVRDSVYKRFWSISLAS